MSLHVGLPDKPPRGNLKLGSDCRHDDAAHPVQLLEGAAHRVQSGWNQPWFPIVAPWHWASGISVQLDWRQSFHHTGDDIDMVGGRTGFDLVDSPMVACRGWFVGLVKKRTKNQMLTLN